MDDRGTPINKGPIIGTRDVDLYKLFKVCVESIKCPLLYSKLFSSVPEMLSLQPSVCKPLITLLTRLSGINCTCNHLTRRKLVLEV